MVTTSWRTRQDVGTRLPAAGPVVAEVPPRSRGAGASLRLLEGFELCVGSELAVVPQHSQRVLAFLAVRERAQLRSKVAFSLWADTTEDRARASLRTALWKVSNLGVIRSRGSYLSIADHVSVDLHRLVAQAKRLLTTQDPLAPLDVVPEALTGDLLPDWEDDWLLFERERLRQLSLHALECLSARLSALSRHGEAIDAAQAAVAAEPLRESAQTMLIKAHLAEGNVCEARRQLAIFRGLLAESLAQEPPVQLSDLVRSAAGGRDAPRRSGVHGVDGPAMVPPA